MGKLFENLPLELIDIICEKINSKLLLKFMIYTRILPIINNVKLTCPFGVVSHDCGTPFRNLFFGLNKKRITITTELTQGRGALTCRVLDKKYNEKQCKLLFNILRDLNGLNWYKDNWPTDHEYAYKHRFHPADTIIMGTDLWMPYIQL